MRVIDLTIPIYEGMAQGLVYAQEQPFEIHNIRSWDSGIRLDAFTVYCESGTRLALYSVDATMKDGPKLHETNIVLRDTVVVDIPKGPAEVVTPEEVERAVAKADFREGDAIIFRTGWGDGERYRKLGDDWVLESPHFGRDDTCKKILEIMTAKKSDFYGVDTTNFTDMKATYKDWLAIKPRPKTFPSPEAIAFLRKMEVERDLRKMPPEGIGSFRLFRAGISHVTALVNCGEIKKERVKLIALPLKVEGVGIAPCNVVAIEE